MKQTWYDGYEKYHLSLYPPEIRDSVEVYGLTDMDHGFRWLIAETILRGLRPLLIPKLY